VNDRTRAILVARGCPPEKLSVVMNSPDEGVYREGTALEPFSEGLRLVYVGGINPERDLSVLIRAVGRISRRQEIRLLIVGYGQKQHVETLRTLARSLGLDGSVEFHGRVPQEDVLRYLRSSDLGIVTYERNPLTEVAVPNKVFEYILAGKPLALPDLKAMRDLFDGAAVFYEPGDDQDLADKILQLWTKSVDVDALLRRAQETYRASHWVVMGERLERAYASLLSR
jgi:glycosyltransferase involved in cell wall biosynthesis